MVQCLQKLFFQPNIFQMSDASLFGSSLSEEVMQKTQWMTEGLNLVADGGRSPLHIACDREDDYQVLICFDFIVAFIQKLLFGYKLHLMTF